MLRLLNLERFNKFLVGCFSVTLDKNLRVVRVIFETTTMHIAQWNTKLLLISYRMQLIARQRKRMQYLPGVLILVEMH